MLISTTVLLKGQEIKRISDSDKKFFDGLTDDEKFLSLKMATNSYVDLREVIDRANDRQEILSDELKKTNEALKKKYLDHSLSLSVLAGIDTKLHIDCYAILQYKRYLLYNRAYITVGGAFKFYDSYGGGLLFGLGINF